MNIIGEKIHTEPLKDLVQDMHQGINTVIEKVDYLTNGIPIIQSKHITKGYLHFNDAKFLSKEAYSKYKKKYQPKVDDLLVCNIGTIGKSLRVSKENQFLIAWNLFLIKINKEKLFSTYFAHYLNYLADKKYFDRFLTGGTVKFINKKTMGNIPIPLPPLNQQKKIAAILDAADTYRQKTKALIAKYDELTQSLFLDMFGSFYKDIDCFKSIKSVSNFIDYRGKTPERTNSGIPLISAKCVRPGYFDKSRLDFLSKETYEKVMSRGYPKVGDVLFTTEGATMGYTCRIPEGFEKFAVGQRIITLQSKKIYNNITLEFVLNSKEIQGEIFKQATGSAAKGIRSAKFAQILVPVPPLDLQNQFAERVQAIETQKTQAKASLAKAEDLFNSLLQRAFKGELI